jgi:RimJ/RimL family protein N-acetyltransferase
MQTEQRFLDDRGRLQQWPSKQSDKLLALAYLAAKFDFDTIYTEAEVNELLKRWHTFNDWPLLRRELYERGFLERDNDGSNYHLKRVETSLPGLYLTSPNLKTDPAISVKWLDGAAGRETLRLMGNTEADNKPTTLPAEERRVRGFITSTDQKTWSLRYHGKTVGALWLSLKPATYLGAPSIHIMIGDPAARAKGIGPAAVLAVIKLLRQGGEYRELYSRHLVENTASAKLLAKVGFVKDGAEYQDTDGLMFQNVKRHLKP